MESILKKTEDYIENRIDIIRLKTIDKSSEVISTLITQFVLIACGALTVLMVSVGVALLIGYWLDKTYLGFLIVGLFYALVSLVLYVYRKKWLKEGLQEILIKKFLE